MNAPVTADQSETQKIENALDALLTAAIQANRDKSLLPDQGPTPAGALVFDFLEKLSTWTKAQRSADELFARPVWEITRQGVSTLGRRLYELGGMPLMQDVCQRVANLDPANRGRRLDIMDKRWDGIGEWVS